MWQAGPVNFSNNHAYGVQIIKEYRDIVPPDTPFRYRVRCDVCRCGVGSHESKTKPVMHFGMIAEDLAAAGLEMLVSRGQDGELEGIQYDRIAPALLPVIKNLQDRIEKLEEQLNGTKSTIN